MKSNISSSVKKYQILYHYDGEFKEVGTPIIAPGIEFIARAMAGNDYESHSQQYVPSDDYYLVVIKCLPGSSAMTGFNTLLLREIKNEKQPASETT